MAHALRTILLAGSHATVAAAGFAAGIYALPILIAPAAPSADELKAATTEVQFTGEFKSNPAMQARFMDLVRSPSGGFSL